MPQVARNLQTEPIIPPGAFPDGGGDTRPYTASVSSAELESTAAIAAQIFAEAEAARQAAARRKAEEEVRDTAVDPHEYRLEEQSELRALANELEEDIQLVQKDAFVLETLPGDSGFAASIAAGTAVSTYAAWADTVASGLRYLANLTEEDWDHNLYSRRYLIEIQFVQVKNIGDIFDATQSSFKIIYNATDWYCKNEGVWGSGNSYKTYYNCGEAGIWGIDGAFM